METECWANGVGSPYVDAQGEGVYNDWTIAICFAGENPTDGQWTAIKRVAAALDDLLPQTQQLTAHGLLPNGGTECAGPVVNSRLTPPKL